MNYLRNYQIFFRGGKIFGIGFFLRVGFSSFAGGAKLNLSLVGLRVACFSVCREIVKWFILLNFSRHFQVSNVVFYHWR